MKFTCRLLALPALVALLSACGEGSNTLTDPKVSEAETITSCENNSSCVDGVFVSEPVVGLNYVCNLVEGVTDENGLFSCPNKSTVTFFLKSSTGNRKITIGKYHVNFAGGKQFSKLFVTPEDLVTAVDGHALTTAQLSNVLRLLQALDSDGTTSNNTINRIVIDPKDKKAIDKLDADIVVSDFSKTDIQFDQLLEPMFSEITGKSISAITSEQAVARYQSALPMIHSGVYEVAPSLFTILRNDGTKFFNGMFGRFDGSDLYSMVTMFVMVDREGKAIGNALEWKSTLADSNNSIFQSRLFFEETPAYLDFNSNEVLFENNGNVKPNFLLNSATGKVKISQGKIFKGFISSDAFMYRDIYGLPESTEIDSNSLGKWQRFGLDNQIQLTGTFNIEKSHDVNMYLDNTIWKTIDNVSVGEKPIFPLHLKLILRDNDRTPACGGETGNGCVLGEMGITILDNGNIITDRDSNCSTVDAITLQDSSTAMQEQRLGLVTTVLSDTTNKAIPLITPMILVGSWARQLPATDPWSKFYGVYMGANSTAGGRRLQLDLTRLLINKKVILQHQKDDVNPDNLTPEWENYINFILLQNKNISASEKTAINTKQKGIISDVQVQSCYDPQPKQ